MKAAIDCGTNSFRLLIVDDGGVPVVQELRITRLGEGVHEHRAIQPQALQRAIAALAEFHQLITHHDVRQVRAVATSAARDASNGAEFLAQAKAALGGVELDILSGQAEGELTFKGVAAGIDASGPMLVMDIGGGSTEFAFGVDGALQWAQSLDLGCVRLTELDLHADPYSAAEIQQATARVAAALQLINFADLPPGTRLIGVAGTVTTLAMIARHMSTYEPDIVHGLRLTVEEIIEVSDYLLHLDNAGRLAIPGLPPGRADVIAAGALILTGALQNGSFMQCTVSERDLLFGLLE